MQATSASDGPTNHATVDRAGVDLRLAAGASRHPFGPPRGGATIGRAREREALAAALRDPATQLLTLVGPGGVGKTHLALAVAAELAPEFRDGIAAVSFAQVSPGAVWETIANHLGVTHAGPGGWPAAVRETLADRELLLVLDNCETILAGLDALPDLLAACPGITALATSREALRIRREREVWLEPLALPEERADWTADALRGSAAIELLTLRAARVRPGFTVTDDTADDLAAIVRMLDGLPLAIELAAAQLRHLSPAALRQRLTAALPTLGDGARDIPDRHQSLRATVSWSLDLLPDHERDAFLQLALFAGGVTPDAACAVIGDIPGQHGWDLLLGFANRSLLHRVVDTDEANPRFLMLETVRAVALDLLRRRPELHLAARERHARHIIALAEEASRNFHGPDQLVWLQRIDTEHANIAAVMEAAPDDPEGVRRAIQLAGPMFWYWYTRGYHTWALPLLERLLARVPADVPDPVRCAAHVTAGWLAFKQAQVERADLHFARAKALCPEPDTPVALLGRIGAAYVLSFDRSDMTDTAALLHEIGERASDVDGAWHEEAAAHFGAGLHLYFVRELPEARTSFERSIRILRAHDDRQGIGLNLVYLAHCDRLTDDPRSALWKLQEALPLLFAVGDRASVALTLDGMIATLADLGETTLARQTIAVDEELRRTYGIARSPLEHQDYVESVGRLDAAVAAGPPAPLGEAIDALLQFRPEPAPAAETPATTTPAPAIAAADVLSPREIEVLHLVAAGLPATEIAARLYVSRHTVKRHMANIRQKLGVRSQAAAVAALQQRGIIPPA